jgi:hypothetical protein
MLINRLDGLFKDLVILFIALLAIHAAAEERPNLVLCMADDQGWGDTGYNGHPHIKTPVMDEMALTGLRFDRFSVAHPVPQGVRGTQGKKVRSLGMRYPSACRDGMAG